MGHFSFRRLRPCPHPAPSPENASRLLNRWLLMGTVIGIVSWRQCHYLLLSENRHALATRDVGHTYRFLAGRRSPAPGSPAPGPIRSSSPEAVSDLGVLRRAYLTPLALTTPFMPSIHDPTALKGKVAAVRSSSLVARGSGGVRLCPDQRDRHLLTV